MSKSAVRNMAGEAVPTTENDTVSSMGCDPKVIAFPSMPRQSVGDPPQRWARRDRRVYEHSCCSICGTGWGAAPGAARQGATCKPSTCAACGSIVCQSHGLGNGRCPICLIGLLSGWGGNNRPCRYKGCQARAVALDGRWHVCAAHLERRRPGYVAARLAEREKAWEWLPPKPQSKPADNADTANIGDAGFVAAVRSAGASVYAATVQGYRKSEPTWQDEQEPAEPAETDADENREPARARQNRSRTIAHEAEEQPPRRGRTAALKGEGNQPQRRQFLTEREIEQLCDAARKRGRYGHRDATMILIAYRHGLRVSELVALQWSQIDLEAGRLQVIRRKGSDDSVQPLSGVEIRALRRVLREQPAGLRHVFVSERGAPFTANGFFKTLTRAAISVGLTDVHPHLLRHACGFKLVNDGVDTRTLAAYLGHRQIANTARYTKMNAKRFDGFWQD